MEDKKIEYLDDTKEEVGLLIFQRLPWLILGLVGGIFASLIVSKFEAILSQYISLAFFLPLIVYLSDAMGTQTQTIFVRNIARPGKHRFSIYVIKESLLGLVVGIVLGILVAIASFIWLNDFKISLTLFIAILINMMTAPLIALLVSQFIFKSHNDPAIGSGPVTTIIQDIISILLYFLIAYIVLLR